MIHDDRDMIRQRFSLAASRYAALADIQAGLARRLALKLEPQGMVILDVGAGDGAVAEDFCRAGGRVVALDAAEGMVAAGRCRVPQAEWVLASASALPFDAACFDVVVSASAYQWVDDLPQAFREARRVLKASGVFLAVMFVRGTLTEFFQSLQRAAAVRGKPLPLLRQIPSVDDVRRAMNQAGFREFRIMTEQRTTYFSSVAALLGWLKGIGANSLSRNFYWGKGLLALTEKEYRAQFALEDKLRVTFELVWIEAAV
ncbi:MAG: methyltransferase domain-containing protein [Candidatus Omnitrophota bacterium]